MRTLAYWKGRRQDLRIILNSLTERDEYYTELWQSYLYAIERELEIENAVLQRR